MVDSLDDRRQNGGSTSFTYTSDQLTSRSDPAGTTSIAYDANGRVSNVTTPFSATAVHYTYDAAGRQLTRTDPSGLTTTRVYDTSYTGRLLSEGMTGATGTYSFALTYDAGGNVLTQNQTLAGNADSGTWTYTYDGQSRLKTAQLGANPVTTYAYDGAGNRNSVKVGTGTPVTTSYDSAGLPTSSSDGSSFSFDAVGNMTALAGSRNWTFTFDSWNRTKTAVAGGGSPSITYAYDALDRMIQRQRNAATVNYKYVGESEDVSSVAGGTTTTYAYATGGPLAQSSGGTVKVYVPNLHGDLALIADTNTNVTGTQAYKPFGEKGATTGDTSIFSFQTDLTDGDTGFVDMGTRLYDPQSGRFSIRDSVLGDLRVPSSLNQYVYGGDNPVSMIDPNGMCFRDLDNQAGCGYTMNSDPKYIKRYDPSFGKSPYGYMCWHCASNPLTSIHGADIAPPPPPGPPKGVVFATKDTLAGAVASAQRINHLVAINDYETATGGQLQAVFDQFKPQHQSILGSIVNGAASLGGEIVGGLKGATETIGQGINSVRSLNIVAADIFKIATAVYGCLVVGAVFAFVGAIIGAGLTGGSPLGGLAGGVFGFAVGCAVGIATPPSAP